MAKAVYTTIGMPESNFVFDYAPTVGNQVLLGELFIALGRLLDIYCDACPCTRLRGLYRRNHGQTECCQNEESISEPAASASCGHPTSSRPDWCFPNKHSALVQIFTNIFLLPLVYSNYRLIDAALI